jgi:lipid-A-disaccharide synthase
MSVHRIGIVVGEHSGEKLAIDLIKNIRARVPGVEVYGVIGKELRDMGCVAITPMETISVMGFVEPLLNIRRLLKFRKWVVDYFLQDPPDLFIGIDSPEFNLYVEGKLKSAGIPTVHYVSPSVWAWRQGRVKTIQNSVDLMLTLFPFEKKFYDNNAVDSCFVGHPAADKIPLEVDSKTYRKLLGLGEVDDKTVLAILPGSRNSEIKHNLDVYIQSANLLNEELKKLYVLFPCVSEDHQSFIEERLKENSVNFPYKILVGASWQVMGACDIALVTSGTATLEVMLHKKPMVIAYKTNWLNYNIAKRMLKVKHIGLPNLIAGDSLVKELIQDDATPENICRDIKKLLAGKNQEQVQEKFLGMHKSLKKDASKQAAGEIISMLGWEY